MYPFKKPRATSVALGFSLFRPALSKALKSPAVWIALAAVALIIGLEVASRRFPRLDLLKRIEWITYDWRMRQASRLQADAGTNFGFVFIGDETIDVFSRGELHTNLLFGLYWPRHIYGRLIEELSAQRARAVGLDVLFAELRTDHLPTVARGSNVVSDEYFIRSLRDAGNVVLGATPEVLPHPKFRRAAMMLGNISTARDADGVLRRAKAFDDHPIWHEEIRKQARLSGWDLNRARFTSNQVVFTSPTRTNTLSLTEDGLFDPYDLVGGKPPGGFSRLFPAYENVRVWHLGIVLAAVELGLDLSRAQIDLSHGRITLPSTNGAARVLPVDAQGHFLIDWTMRLDDPRLTREAFESVITSGILRQLGSNVPPRFADKLVVIGSTAIGNELSDRGATPLDKDTFLTSNNWNVMNSLVTNRFVRELPRWADLLLIGVLGLAGSVFTCKLSAQRAAVTAALLALVYVAAAVAAFVFARHALPLVTPLVALFVCYAALVTYQVLFEQGEKRRVKDLFSRLVSPSVVQELLKAANLSLVGKRRRLTVLFADIRGFTEMTDRSHARAEDIVRDHQLEGAEAENIFDRESQEVVQTVNRYLGTIADTIKKHDGTLDKYIGDCVMAFWGAPTVNERHAADCVHAAIEAQRAVARLNEERREENARRERANFERMALGQTHAPLPLLDVLSVGSGINTGTVDAGLMGSQDAQNYTIFGRDVNVASRLEKLSGSGRILIGEETYRDLQKYDPALAATCLELPPADIRGLRAAIKIYEVPWK